MIEPGTKVRNKLTGEIGYVVIRSEYLAGYTQIRVQKEGKSSWLERDSSSDENEWHTLPDAPFERPPTPDEEPNHFELGQRVKDIITGFTGIVNSRSEHISRCWTYDVQAEMVNKESGLPGPLEAFSSQRLELVDDGYWESAEKPAAVPAAVKVEGKGKKEARIKATPTGATHYTPQR